MSQILTEDQWKTMGQRIHANQWNMTNSHAKVYSDTWMYIKVNTVEWSSQFEYLLLSLGSKQSSHYISDLYWNVSHKRTNLLGSNLKAEADKDDSDLSIISYF